MAKVFHQRNQTPICIYDPYSNEKIRNLVLLSKSTNYGPPNVCISQTFWKKNPTKKNPLLETALKLFEGPDTDDLFFLQSKITFLILV